MQTQWNKEFGQVWSHHPYLASKAMLNALKSRNPIPPSSFGVHIFSLFNQANLLWFSCCPHQKRLTIPTSSSHKASGSLKQLIIYDGIAWAIDFMRIFLLAFERSFSFKLDSLFHNFSFKSLKVLHLDQPTSKGNPKYFSCYRITGAPKGHCISSWMDRGIFLLKNETVLFLFNCWPDTNSYTEKICYRTLHSSNVAWQKISLSSAKNKWEMRGAPWQTATPLMLPLSTHCLIKLNNPATQSQYR